MHSGIQHADQGINKMVRIGEVNESEGSDEEILRKFTEWHRSSSAPAQPRPPCTSYEFIVEQSVGQNMFKESGHTGTVCQLQRVTMCVCVSWILNHRARGKPLQSCDSCFCLAGQRDHDEGVGDIEPADSRGAVGRSQIPRLRPQMQSKSVATWLQIPSRAFLEALGQKRRRSGTPLLRQRRSQQSRASNGPHRQNRSSALDQRPQADQEVCRAVNWPPSQQTPREAWVAQQLHLHVVTPPLHYHSKVRGLQLQLWRAEAPSQCVPRSCISAKWTPRSTPEIITEKGQERTTPPCWLHLFLFGIEGEHCRGAWEDVVWQALQKSLRRCCPTKMLHTISQL